MQTATQGKPVAYLRPDQVEEMEGEREALTRKLNNPGIQDKGQVADQLRRLDHQLETQRPKPFSSDEIDAAVRRERELRERWTQGMLSAEEMRKAPHGATDRHIAWERRNKRVIGEWQNLMRRLHAGSDAREVASIERFRPQSTMNMQGALIEGKQFYLPPEDAALGVTFTEFQMQELRGLGLADTVALLDNDQRAALKAKFFPAPKAAIKEADLRAGPKGKRKVYVTKQPRAQLSDAHRAALKAGRDRYNAQLAAKKEAEAAAETEVANEAPEPV